MDVPPAVSDHWRTYLPARAMAETFGNVDWDAATRTVTITGNLEEKRTHTQYPVSDTLFYQLAHGYSTQDAFDIYLERRNPEEKTGALLSFPESNAANYKAQGIDSLLLKSVKVSDAGALIAVETPMIRAENNSVDLYFDDMTSDKLIPAGASSRFGDYATDGKYVYMNDGVMPSGAIPVEPRKFYIKELGGKNRFAEFDLDFDINECTLEVKDGKLLATDPKGTVHSLDTAELIKKAGFSE